MLTSTVEQIGDKVIITVSGILLDCDVKSKNEIHEDFKGDKDCGEE